MQPRYISVLLVLLAVITFVLTAFGVTVGDTTPVEMTAAGLAFFAAAHLVP
jgi:hypothetical protein